MATNQPSQNIDEPVLPAHALESEAVLGRLASSTHGLDEAEVARRRAIHGPNALPEATPPGFVRVFIRQFFNPLIYVLLIAAIIALALGDWLDAVFIGAVLLINALVGAIQEWNAQRSTDALKHMIISIARVVRAGESREIDAAELVPGDIVMLESGMRVPADIRLLRDEHLEIDESILTGESLPVTKNAAGPLPEDAMIGDRFNMAFAGTMVYQGRGLGVVASTASNTEVGRLARSLSDIESARAPLIQRMEQFTWRLMAALAAVVILIVGMELARGAPLGQILMVGIALAVSAIPEGLPVALTVALAVGVRRMAKRNVIVRRLVAVESLGSCNVIASDKTGTLTMNELTVRRIVLPWGENWDVSGEGIVPEGVIRPAGSEPGNRAAVERLARTAVLCNEAYLGLRKNEWVGEGDSVDVALLVMGHKIGFTQASLGDAFPVLARIAYEPARGFAASAHADGDGVRIMAKGAIEKLLPMCTRMTATGTDTGLVAQRVQDRFDELAAQGYRVLAFADVHVDRERFAQGMERCLEGMTLIGLTGMLDPPRPEAGSAIKACQRAGIRVVMITGDHPRTGLAVAREMHIADSADDVVTGAMLKALAPEDTRERERIMRNARVFARVEPAQKLEIVQAMTKAGDFVAVTGDGVNDAPALSFAHVGVAMGRRGTDVARESSDIVIADDHFASVAAGIEEGRVAYQNIRKVILLLVSTGAAEVLLFLLAMMAGMPLPLTAVQLLWLNLVTNGVQHLALAFEPAEGDEMRRPPRSTSEAIFNRLLIQRVLLSAAVMGGMCFLLFRYLLAAGYDVESARNLVLLLMVLFENVQVFNSRSETRSVLRQRLFNNPLILLAVASAQLIHVSAMYIPGLNTVLGMSPVEMNDWMALLALALSLLLAVEAHKAFRASREKATAI